jgi:DNA-binding NarL/FixJ family response regulator
MTKKRLLIVEDNIRLLRAIAVCLAQAGYETMTARDGIEANLQIAETIPDLIISDIMMPGSDGYRLVKQLRANPRTDLIPIIFLTAKDTRRDRIEGIRAGVDAYLVKPFEPEELLSVIGNILSRISRTHTRLVNTDRAGADSLPVTDNLTKSEKAIAELVAEGLTNIEIADRLSVSKRTVESHISSILSKNGWQRRIEIIRHFM